MFSFKTTSLGDKLYRAKIFTISMSGNGIDPQDVKVKVLNIKKPTAEVSVGIGWFSDSRGYGGQSNKFVRLTDLELVSLCRGVLADDTGIAPLIDMLTEKAEQLKYAGGTFVNLIARWWVLAQQENPTAFVAAERKQKAFDDKRFKVGDRVAYRSRHGFANIEATITGERFDWADWRGGGWRFSFEANRGGYDVPQLELSLVASFASVV